MTVIWDPEDERVFAPFEPLTELIFGPHNIFIYNGVTYNDRRPLECIWVEDPVGFNEHPAPRISSQENVQESGSLPDPGFYGERTMTLAGWIQAGSYPQIMKISKILMDSLIGLSERPMVISTLPGSMFTQPDVMINCRPAGQPSLSTRIEQADQNGLFKRQFSLSFVASTHPFFVSVETKSGILLPTVVSQFGRVYPRTYDLVYTTPIDGTGTPTAGTGANTIVLTNDGNWRAKPIIRFNGGATNIGVTNTTNGQKIIINGTIPADDYYELDIQAGTIVNSAGDNMAEFLDTSSDWMVLEGRYEDYSGNNVITAEFDAYDSAASIQFFYADTSV